MAKARVSLLPPRVARVDTLPLSLPGHEGEVHLHLRAPDHNELLRVVEARDERAREWCKPDANWFPSSTGQPFPVTRALLGAAMLVLFQQCAENGDSLPAEETYSESELIDLCGSSVGFLVPVTDKFNEYLSVLEPDPKNCSAAGADS